VISNLVGTKRLWNEMTENLGNLANFSQN